MSEPVALGSTLESQAHALSQAYGEIRRQMGRRIVGQEEVLEQLLIALFAGGHCLLIGVPGLAKTLIIRTLSELVDLSFSRIQFTPDLMPSDITGTEVMVQEGGGSSAGGGARFFRFVPGPIFAQVVLADEINRTPPKTQAALMEAMEEQQVTSHGKRHPLPGPFFVLATQNPIEQEGTYPLPAAQLDRFMFSVTVDYPSADEEYRIVRLTTGSRHIELPCVLDADRIRDLMDLVSRVEVPREVMRYAVALCRATRVGRAKTVPEWLKAWISWGVGPRGPHFLLRGARARALLSGRTRVRAEDIRALALPVLRHRLMTTYHAEAEGVTTDMIVRRLIGEIEGPGGGAVASRREEEGWTRPSARPDNVERDWWTRIRQWLEGVS